MLKSGRGSTASAEMVSSAASVPVGGGQEGAAGLADHPVDAGTETLAPGIRLGFGRGPERLEGDGEQ